MKVQIESLGCKVNSVEAESIAELFRQRGHIVVKHSAEVVVINTCCVTSEAESKSRQAIRKAIKNGAIVAVMGCYSQLSPEELRDIGVSVIVGVADRQSIAAKVEAAFKISKLSAHEQVFGDTEQIEIPEISRNFEELPHVPSKTRAFMKIQDGCNGACTYCIIPKVRGPERSRSLESIERECKHLTAYKEIVITGINLGKYGTDINQKLEDAINVVLKNTSARIRLSSIEPNELTDDLIEFIKSEPRICRHMHIPIQSASNAVLEMMHRGYTVENVTDFISKLKRKMPEMTIGTDVIAAFPGETEEMFRQTLAHLEQLPLGYMHVFGYSPREGTIAAAMTQISSQEKKARVGQLLSLATKMNLEYRKSLQGSEAEVLTETQREGFTEGHSAEYIKVYIQSNLPPNELIKVKISEIYRDGVLGVPVSL